MARKPGRVKPSYNATVVESNHQYEFPGYEEEEKHQSN